MDSLGKKLVERYCKHQGYGNYSVSENELIEAINEVLKAGYVDKDEARSIIWEYYNLCMDEFNGNASEEAIDIYIERTFPDEYDDDPDLPV